MITKDLFLQVIRCSKAAYMSAKMPKNDFNQSSAFIPENIEDLQNKLAAIICPQAINIKSANLSISESREHTSTKMKKQGIALRNATFISNEMHTEVDCIVNGNKLSVWLFSVNRGELYENDIYAAAYQYFVITKCGYKIDNFSIITLNKNYNSSNALQALIKVNAVTHKVKAMCEEVEEYIDLLRKTLKKEHPPLVQLGHQCALPWNCPFMAECWKHVKPGNIFEFSDLSFPQKFRYYRQGIIQMEDIKPFVKLSEPDRIQLSCHLFKQEFVDCKKLSSILTKVNNQMFYSLELLWLKAAIPEYPNTSPFNNVPFHFSVRKCNGEKNIIKNKTIGNAKSFDTRRELIVDLIKSLNEFSEIPIVVWDKDKIKEQFVQYTLFYPEFEQVFIHIKRRLIGLAEIIKTKTFYSPAFFGRSDLRAMAKFLKPDFHYSNIEISGLWKAKQAYLRLKEGDIKDPRIILSNLAQYSNQNSLVMMETVAFLIKKIK